MPAKAAASASNLANILYTPMLHEQHGPRRAAAGEGGELGRGPGRGGTDGPAHEGTPMNSNFRNLAIWVVIGLLLMALFNLFQNPSQRGRGNEISYSDFLAGVDAGNISEV